MQVRKCLLKKGGDGAGADRLKELDWDSSRVLVADPILIRAQLPEGRWCSQVCPGEPESKRKESEYPDWKPTHCASREQSTTMTFLGCNDTLP